jgi:hypothetical protein
LVTNPQNRIEAVRAAIEKLGGRSKRPGSASEIATSS